MSTGYPIDQCGLYRVRSKRTLAKRLLRSEGFLISRANRPELYRVWEEPKSSGGTRTIEAPREDLKIIQKRIARLLQRVLAPKYLYSPVKGLSYMDNALAHRGAAEVRLLDVRNYFGNCQAQAVNRFFADELRCVPDVAYILTGLTTRNEHLPQGSPCSPILSFYCCKPMWEEIERVVTDADCKITIYVDDITISGPVIHGKTIWAIKAILKRYGHSHHPNKERRHLNRAAEITGIMVSPGGVSVPHRHFKKLQASRLAAQAATDETTQKFELARARSLESQIQLLNRLGG